MEGHWHDAFRYHFTGEIVVLRQLVSVIVLVAAAGAFLTGMEEPQETWIEKWDYRLDEVYPIRLQVNSIPLVEIKVNDSPLWVKFDTGCSTGLTLTSAVEKEIAHKVTGKSTERNPDGSYRGETTLATVASIEVFGQKHTPVETSFTDWRIFSVLEFNGLLGLKYFRGKRVTIDYKGKKIGITGRPFENSTKRDFSGGVVPLLEATGSQADLIYVPGRVQGRPTVIYLDTGSSASFIDPSMVEAGAVKKGKRHLIAEDIEMSIGKLSFVVKSLRVQEQRRGVNFEYPQTVKLGSDVIREFLITIDKISGRMFLSKN